MRTIERASSKDCLARAAHRAIKDFERSLYGDAVRNAMWEANTWREDVARMIEPGWAIKEALSVFEDNSIAEAIREQAELLDRHRSPIEELFREQEAFANGPIAELMGEIKASSAFDLASLLPETNKMSNLLGDPFSAAAALAEVRSIGIGVSAGLAFDMGFADALRVDIGDWRDEITWPAGLESTAEVRETVYAELGLTLRVDALPALSMGHVFGLAPIDGAGDEESDQILLPGDADQRAEQAFQTLRRLEIETRRWMDALMTRAFGENWADLRVAPKVRDLWREKQAKAVRQGLPAGRLIDYADFMDYQMVICQDGNWTRVFEVGFVRKESVRESFQRLHPVRLAVMHSRDITNKDLLYLVVEAGRLRSCLERMAMST